MSVEVRAVMKEWEATRPFAGSRCPITAAVAQLKLKQNQYKEALELFAIARREVPDYTSWQLEYTYFLLLCRQKLNGSLDAADRQLAEQSIRQGHFLSQHFAAGNDFIERYTGLLHILRGEFAEAVPFLELSRKKCTGIDRLAVDQALMVSYLTIGQADRAKEILSAGAAAGGEFAVRYHSLLQRLPALESSRASAPTNTPATSRP
jgi:predicted Zn-dependent protease